jgi:hypothetical protein
VALEPHRQQSTDVSVREGSEHERPEQWGWHGTFPRATQIAGWLTVGILLLMTTATHYNNSGTMWLVLFAGGIALGLILDIRARKNAWRR